MHVPGCVSTVHASFKERDKDVEVCVTSCPGLLADASGNEVQYFAITFRPQSRFCKLDLSLPCCSPPLPS